MTVDRTIKITASICFVLLAVALLVISNSPATEYEPSIYEATPLVVWGFLIFSIACGIGIVVHQVFNKHENRNLWVIGLALILLSATIIISLHILRGYTLFAITGDPGSHLGSSQDVIASGYVSKDNIYPITHIYLAQLSLVAGTNPIVWFKWLPVLFALLYMMFIYFLAKSVLPNKGQVILATVAGTALISGWYLNLTPNHLSNLIFPLVLYLLVRSFTPGTMSWKLLFLVMVFLIPAFHPVPAAALLIVLWTISLPGKLLASFSRGASGLSDNRLRFNASVSILLLAFTITWLSSFYVWAQTILNIKRVAAEGGPTPFTALMEIVGPGVEHAYSVAWQFFLHYTSIVIYIVLALIALFVLWRRRKNSNDTAILWGLYGPIFSIAGFIVLLYFTFTMFGPLRLLFYITLMCTIFVGFMLYEFMRKFASNNNNWRAKVAPLITIVLLLAVSVNGIVIVYGSPYTLKTNSQTTQAEIQGMDYLLHHIDSKTPISYWAVTTHRFYDFLLTSDEKTQFYMPRLKLENRIPHHFGYDKYELIGQYYERFEKNKYMVISRKDRIYYTEMFPELAEEYFLPEDFIKLEDDISIDKLYVNGGFDSWYVRSME